MKTATIPSCFLTVAFCAQAQMVIERSTLAGGSGTSAGGGHSVAGTAGQPDAGTMTGGGFTLMGGFWGGTSSILLPPLHIGREGANIVLSWQASNQRAVVQFATRLTAGGAGWANQPQDPVRVGDRFEVNIGSVVQPPDPVRFFRLAQP